MHRCISKTNRGNSKSDMYMNERYEYIYEGVSLNTTRRARAGGRGLEVAKLCMFNVFVLVDTSPPSLLSSATYLPNLRHGDERLLSWLSHRVNPPLLFTLAEQSIRCNSHYAFNQFLVNFLDENELTYLDSWLSRWGPDSYLLNRFCGFWKLLFTLRLTYEIKQMLELLLWLIDNVNKPLE